MGDVPIRGTVESQHEQMVLGQLRKVFDLEWIQPFGNGNVDVTSKPEDFDNVKNFMEMHGYTDHYQHDRVRDVADVTFYKE